MDENRGMRNGDSMPSLDNSERSVRRYLCGELSGREEEEEEEDTAGELAVLRHRRWKMDTEDQEAMKKKNIKMFLPLFFLNLSSQF
jgi:hypothetical protein